jgi:2-oxoglutarate decarboxylase
MKLRDILGVLRDSYCRTVGIEYMHIQDPTQRKWIQAKVENGNVKPSREEQLRILNRLNAAEAFETFLQTKYVGQKRFSLEGGESASRCSTRSSRPRPRTGSTRSSSACRTAAASTC